MSGVGGGGGPREIRGNKPRTSKKETCRKKETLGVIETLNLWREKSADGDCAEKPGNDVWNYVAGMV